MSIASPEHEPPEHASLPWVRAASAGERSAAALCTVANAHGVALDMDRIRALNEGRVPPMATMLSLLGNARRLGLAPTPLEGEYEQLPSVPLPALVPLREGGQERFVVLAEVGRTGVRIVDPCTGPQWLPEPAFVERWSGDVVVVEDDPVGRRGVEAELAALARPWRRLAFLGASAAVVGATAAAATLADAPVARLLAAGGLAGGFVGSVWLATFGAACKVCSKGKLLSGGLPLEWVGMLAYGGLAPLVAGWDRTELLAPLLGLAAGGHLVLMDLLRRHRVACKACLTVGALVIAAAMLVATAVAPSATSTVAAVLVGVLGMLVTLGLAVRRIVRRSSKLGWATAAEMAVPPPGTAQLVVYKRRGCGACVLFETALRPALVDELGEALRIEECYRDEPLLTPLIVGVGSGLELVALGLGRDGAEHERLRTIASVLAGRSSPAALEHVDDVLVRPSPRHRSSAPVGAALASIQPVRSLP